MMLPSLPTAIPCMICGTLGQPEDPRYAAHVIRSGEPGVILFLWCIECGKKRLLGSKCTIISRAHALQLFEHYFKAEVSA